MAKVNTSVYVDREILETAKELGLNVSKVTENSLIEAIGKLTGTKLDTGLDGPPPTSLWGRGRDSDSGARLHRPGETGDLLQGFFDFCRVDLGLAVVHQ